MKTYQSGIRLVDGFLNMLPSNSRDILEIGSDIAGKVASALAKSTGVRVIGLNLALDFPNWEKPDQERNIPFFIRADGRSLPFPNDSFDAILSVSTMEHVNGIEELLAEVARVLKPKGLFYTTFGPIWSCAKGHHVCAKAGSKEARFWKPGKNPIPDYAHLLMTPEEMRTCLRLGPCCEELVEPIIQWVYYRDDINRCHFGEYMEAFQKSSLETISIKLGNNTCPDAETLASLHSKYGVNRNFTCSSISVVFIKLPQARTIDSFMFKCSVHLRQRATGFMLKWSAKIAERFPENQWFGKSLRKMKRIVLETR